MFMNEMATAMLIISSVDDGITDISNTTISPHPVYRLEGLKCLLVNNRFHPLTRLFAEDAPKRRIHFCCTFTHEKLIVLVEDAD